MDADTLEARGNSIVDAAIHCTRNPVDVWHLLRRTVMFLRKISYVQFAGTPREWKLEQLALGSLNLIVGKNATGKTRALNIIKNLAGLLCGVGKLEYYSGSYELSFADDESTMSYILHYESREIQREELVLNGKSLLQRGKGGEGRIFAKKLNDYLEFQSPTDELAAVSRRDSIQHPFFALLYDWATNVRHFAFGTPLGQDQLMALVPGPESELDLKDTTKVHQIFKKGVKEYGKSFADYIIEDMAALDYGLDEVGLVTPTSLAVKWPGPGQVLGLYVKEKGLGAMTDQGDMSQGMFRALSLMVQLTYAWMSGRPSCILIDDIGEGLDFERSGALIHLLMEKTREHNVQLVMATNDRFVMNIVPLESWSVLQRHGSTCRIFNYENSRSVFEDFKFTGMSNFDFLAYDFLNRGLE
jgi:hypothetical protein